MLIINMLRTDFVGSFFYISLKIAIIYYISFYFMLIEDMGVESIETVLTVCAILF